MEFEGLPRQRRMPTLTPLIDIVFLLLVFFLLTAHFVEDRSLNINLPEADSAEAIEDDVIVEILLGKDGSILINKNPVNINHIEQAVLEVLHQSKRKQVVVRGDQSVQLGITVKVMDAARKAGAESLDILTRTP